LNMAVDILRQGVVGALNERQQDLLRGAKFDCDRLIKLVGDLLDLTRLESGRFEVKEQLVSISQVIQQSLQPFRLSLEQRGLNLNIDILTQRAACVGDIDQVFIVLTNLLNNAMRHTAEGGEITIEVKDADGCVRFCVADSGSGIPEQDLEHIFDRFVQLKDQDSATPGSVGLGLAIARKSVEMQGGKMWAESDFGRGSRFFFTLPVEKEAENE
jgi:two-component system, NtrC family, sensor histidine kinase KinB